jgi:hypothetical protein
MLRLDKEIIARPHRPLFRALLMRSQRYESPKTDPLVIHSIDDVLTLRRIQADASIEVVLYKAVWTWCRLKMVLVVSSHVCSFSFRFVSLSLELKEQEALTAVGDAQHRIGRVGNPDRTQTHNARQTGCSRTGRGKVCGGRGTGAKSRRTKRRGGRTHETSHAYLFFQFKLSMLSILLLLLLYEGNNPRQM